MSKNPLTLIMDTNKCNGTNYTDWLRNLTIVLDFKNQGYVLDKPLPTALPEGSSSEEHLTFNKWLEDNCKVHSIILASMTNEIQKQYDRLDNVPSIMLRLKEERLQPQRRKVRVPDTERGRRARDRLSQPLLAPQALLLPRWERAKGRLRVLTSQGQIMCAWIAKERIGEEASWIDRFENHLAIVMNQMPIDKLDNPCSWVAHWIAAMKPTSEGWSETLKVETSRLGIKSPIETYIKYCIHWMSVKFHRQQTWDVYAILVD
ncbi:UNVERIFIED_CONTAM: hypothetical protein Slati_4413000, partial [Sesamum latifolium]